MGRNFIFESKQGSYCEFVDEYVFDVKLGVGWGEDFGEEVTCVETEGAEERKGNVYGFFGNRNRRGSRFKNSIEEPVYGPVDGVAWKTILPEK